MRFAPWCSFTHSRMVVPSDGYDLYYLNVVAGPNRRWVFKSDPAMSES